MRRIPFTETEILQLKKERTEHEHPIVRRRMMAWYMKAVGYRHKEICCELDSLLRPNVQSFINVTFNP